MSILRLASCLVILLGGIALVLSSAAAPTRSALPRADPLSGLKPLPAGSQDLARPEARGVAGPLPRRPATTRPGWAPAAWRLPLPSPAQAAVPPHLLKYLEAWPSPGTTAAQAWPPAGAEDDADMY